MTSASTPSLALVDPADRAAIQTALAALVAPGSFFTGAERFAIASHARVARGLATTAPDLAPILATTAARIAADAITTRPEHITAWEDDGRDVLAYIELVAVVALIASIDSYRVGVGEPLDDLPKPTPGDPVPQRAEDAQTMNAWVPTVGIALAPTALSALPNEKANKDALNKTWYLTDEFVHKYGAEPGRELSRPQMELVASRTSWLNECFFWLFGHAWMLRESCKHQDQPVNVVHITNTTLDPLLPAGRELTAFVDAIVLLDFDELPTARQALHDVAGPGAVTRAAAVCAGFEGTNRVVDAVGVPVNKKFYDIGDELGITVPEHLRG